MLKRLKNWSAAPHRPPLTGHAAALNPDGSTRIRRLDQGMDPGVELVKGGGKFNTSPEKPDGVAQHPPKANGFSWPPHSTPTVPSFPQSEDSHSTRSDSGFKNQEPFWFDQSYSDEDKQLVEGIFLKDPYSKKPSTRLDMSGLDHADPTSEPGLQHTYKLYKDFKEGTGPEARVFGPHSLEVDRMKDAPGVKEAREKFYQHDSNTPYDWKAPHRAGFGIPGALKAGDDAIEQFVGSYNCYVIPNEKDQSLLFVITNNTSNKSYTYRQGDAFPRGGTPTPHGNMHQVFTWKEPMDQERIKKQ